MMPSNRNFRAGCLIVIALTMMPGCGDSSTDIEKKFASSSATDENNELKPPGNFGMDRLAPPSEKESSPRKPPSRQNHAVPKSERPKGANMRSESQKRVLIDDVLKRDGLHKKVVEQLNIYKARGITALPERSVEIIINQYDAKAGILAREQSGATPTKSKTERQEPPSEYDVEQVNQFEFLLGRAKFKSIGIEHFKSRKIADLSESARNSAAELMQKTLNGVIETHFPEFWQELLESANQLQADNPSLSIDPMYQYCLGRILNEVGQYQKAEQTMVRSGGLFRTTDYPARVSILPQMLLCYTAKRRVSKLEASHFVNFYRTMDYWLKEDFRAAPDEYRYAFEFTRDFINYSINSNELEVLQRFMDSFSESIHLPPWLRHITRAYYCDKLAWAYRGSGYANTVSEEGWEKFRELQTLANEHYVKAHEIQPLFPEPAAYLIRISTTGYSDESGAYWFEQATRAQPDFRMAFDHRIHGLLPQWGGSVEEMVKFSTTQAKSASYDTMVPWVMLDCYKYIRNYASDEVARDKYLKDPEFLKIVYQALDGLIESETPEVFNGSIADGNSHLLTLKAVIANHGKDYEVAQDAFNRLKELGVYSSAAFREFSYSQTAFEVYRSKSYAFAGKHSSLVKKATALTGDESPSLDALSSVVADLSTATTEDAETESKTYLKRLHSKLEQQYAYRKGEKIDLGFDENLSAWNFNLAGGFSCQDESSLRMHTRETGANAIAWTDPRLPGNKVIEFDLQILDSTKTAPAGNHFTPGMTCLGIRGKPYSIGLNRHFRTKNNTDWGQLAFGYTYSGPDSQMLYYQVPISRENNRIKVLVAQGYFEVYLNDQFVFRSINKIITGPPEKLFSIGQPQSRKGKGEAIFSNVKIEKWNAGPPPISGSTEDLIAFYRQRLNDNPTDKWHQFWLAQAMHKSGDFKDAIREYDKAIKLGLKKQGAAFFIGDCYEHQQDINEAVNWYKIAADASKANYIKVFPGTTTQTFCNSNQWAAFRLNWLKYTSDDKNLRSAAELANSVDPGLPLTNKWANKLVLAAEYASEDQFIIAIPIVKKALADCSVDQEPILRKMLESYSKDTVFRQEEGEPQFYNSFDNSIPFFRSLEDALDPHWRRTY